MIKRIKRYHPERHYMRGPGPKWLEKHSGGIDRIGPAFERAIIFTQMLIALATGQQHGARSKDLNLLLKR